MRFLSFLPLLVLCLASSANAAAYTFHNISDSTATSSNCTVATSSGGVIVVAWEGSDGIWTRSIQTDGVLLDPVFHGAGIEPTLCWNLDGFALAYADGATIICRRGDGSAWTPPEILSPGGSGLCRHPDLCPFSVATEHEIWITWEQAPGTIWFASRVSDAWGSPEVVSTFSSEYDWQRLPQIEPRRGPGYRPRVYYLGLTLPPGGQVLYRERYSSGWNGPVDIVSSDWPSAGAGVQMSVASDPDARQHILSLGPQPLCPCNYIFSVSELPGGSVWGPSAVLTAPYPEPYHYGYAWPYDPAVVVDSEGSIHCFWGQTFFDFGPADPLPSESRLFYKVKRRLTWEDHSSIFDGYAGLFDGYTGGSIAVIIDRYGNPLFVWSEGGNIMLACIYPTVPVDLLSFDAVREGDNVVVTWQVADGPMDHIGFRVCRETPGQDREPINESLLSGQTFYKFVDRGAPVGATEYWLEAVLRDGTTEWHGPLSVGPAQGDARSFVVRSSPNPFFAGTKIRFTNEVEGFVELRVFDMSGREIARPLGGVVPQGVREISWDGRDDRGRPVVPGVYVYTLETASGRMSGKMVKTQMAQ